MFQSTRPVRGATLTSYAPPCVLCVSIHAPRAGRDGRVLDKKLLQAMFQSTRPVRGATRPVLLLDVPVLVSIHAPRAGRDSFAHVGSGSPRCFNPRAPCGARQFVKNKIHNIVLFQSTRPVRGATTFIVYPESAPEFQSTRPVRGATAVQCNIPPDVIVSIHAPRAGRDSKKGHDFPLLPHIHVSYSP